MNNPLAMSSVLIIMLGLMLIIGLRFIRRKTLIYRISGIIVLLITITTAQAFTQVIFQHRDLLETYRTETNGYATLYPIEKVSFARLNTIGSMPQYIKKPTRQTVTLYFSGGYASKGTDSEWIVKFP